jgi:hypothetical protein
LESEEKAPTKSNVGIRVKTEQNKYEEFLNQILGIRVKVRVSRILAHIII